MARGRQPHTAAQKLLMARIAQQFEAKRKLLRKEGKMKVVSQMAEELRVSRASMYNYLNEDDLPNSAVLERAREQWGMTFENDSVPLKEVEEVLQRASKRKPRKQPNADQYVLPFLEAVTTGDIKIIKVEAKKPSSVELILNIKFGT